MKCYGQTFLVTGGAGYIGSHTVVKLLEAGAKVIVLDNLSNAKRDVLKRIDIVTNKRPDFILGDIRDHSLLRSVFNNHRLDAVLHFAGLKAVGESEAIPLKYYDNNVNGSITLIDEMYRSGVKKIVFSSSATVYGDSNAVQYTETTPLKPINVYGRTKLIVEEILRDVKISDPEWKIALLRYFNPVGAHESGLLGEEPAGIPNNLMPYIAQVATGKRERLQIFGADYPTSDGTGERDYIHVEDLAAGHLAALAKLDDTSKILTFNLGTGRPYSVLEVIRAFERAAGVVIPFEIIARRAGDLAAYYADPSLAESELGWKAKLDIERMCADVWRWQTSHLSREHP